MRSNKGEGFPHTENHLAAEFYIRYYTERSGRRKSMLDSLCSEVEIKGEQEHYTTSTAT